jgi:hypothetical protein
MGLSGLREKARHFTLLWVYQFEVVAVVKYFTQKCEKNIRETEAKLTKPQYATQMVSKNK